MKVYFGKSQPPDIRLVRSGSLLTVMGLVPLPAALRREWPSFLGETSSSRANSAASHAASSCIQPAQGGCRPDYLLGAQACSTPSAAPPHLPVAAVLPALSPPAVKVSWRLRVKTRATSCTQRTVRPGGRFAGLTGIVLTVEKNSLAVTSKTALFNHFQSEAGVVWCHLLLLKLISRGTCNSKQSFLLYHQQWRRS